MRIRFAALTAITLATAITLFTGCNKEASNSSNANAGNTTTTSASPTATGTQPSPTATTTTSTAGATTPTDAFNAYYEAIKRKDGEGVKNLFSKGTLSMMEDRAKRGNTTIDAVIKGGLEDAGRDLPAKLPETRNEKIEGDKATLEAKDDKKGTWETLHFAREDGQWKLAFDEQR